MCADARLKSDEVAGVPDRRTARRPPRRLGRDGAAVGDAAPGLRGARLPRGRVKARVRVLRAAVIATGRVVVAELSGGISAAEGVSSIRRVLRERGRISTNGCWPSSAGETSDMSSFLDGFNPINSLVVNCFGASS